MIFYVDVAQGALTTSTGATGAAAPHFVEAQTQSFTFKFLNAPTGWLTGGTFYLTGNTSFAASSPCFRSTGTVDADAGTVTFAVDTYTEEYLAQVKQPCAVMWVDLTRLATGGTCDVRVALIQCAADPRVYIPGKPPTPLSDYYTATETDALLAARVPMPSSGTSAGKVLTVTSGGGVAYEDPQGGSGFLPLSGGTVSGNLTVTHGTLNVTSNLNAEVASAGQLTAHSFSAEQVSSLGIASANIASARIISAAVTSSLTLNGAAVATENTVSSRSRIVPNVAAATSGAIVLNAAKAIYPVSIAAGTSGTITIDSSAINPTAGTTFEIWLTLGSGGAAVWPAGLNWCADPDFVTGLNVVAYRYCGSTIGWRANLADSVEDSE